MHKVGGWGAIALTLIVMSACGSGGGKPDTRVEGVSTERSRASSTSTTSSTTTTTVLTAADLDAEVLQAYRSMWTAVRRALNPPDPDRPELAATHTGPALDAVRSQARSVQAKGAVMRGDVELNPTLESRSATEATIDDCIVDKGHLIDPRTGERLDPDEPEVVNNHARTRMVVVDGVWKRHSSEQLADECTP